VVNFKVDHHQNAPTGHSSAPREATHARSPRRRVVIDGIFQALTGTYRVAIKNLSCTGALIQCDQPLKVGKEGVLEGRKMDHFCRVVWSDGSLYGLQFDSPLSMDVVLELHRITGDDIDRAAIKEAEEWWRGHAR
jgi:hypothetical protein